MLGECNNSLSLIHKSLTYELRLATLHIHNIAWLSCLYTVHRLPNALELLPCSSVAGPLTHITHTAHTVIDRSGCPSGSSICPPLSFILYSRIQPTIFSQTDDLTKRRRELYFLYYVNARVQPLVHVLPSSSHVGISKRAPTPALKRDIATELESPSSNVCQSTAFQEPPHLRRYLHIQHPECGQDLRLANQFVLRDNQTSTSTCPYR